MTTYVLRNDVYSDGALHKQGTVIDGAQYDVNRLIAAGASLVQIPNLAAESTAAKIRGKRKKGKSPEYQDMPFPVDSTSASLQNVAAFNLVDETALQDGAFAYVQTLRSWFVLDQASTAAASPLATILTRGSLGGTLPGRWLRVAWVHPFWDSRELLVDDLNASGTANDENDGLTATTQLRTFAEFGRRVKASNSYVYKVGGSRSGTTFTTFRGAYCAARAATLQGATATIGFDDSLAPSTGFIGAFAYDFSAIDLAAVRAGRTQLFVVINNGAGVAGWRNVSNLSLYSNSTVPLTTVADGTTVSIQLTYAYLESAAAVFFRIPGSGTLNVDLHSEGSFDSFGGFPVISFGVGAAGFLNISLYDAFGFQGGWDVNSYYVESGVAGNVRFNVLGVGASNGVPSPVDARFTTHLVNRIINSGRTITYNDAAPSLGGVGDVSSAIDALKVRAAIPVIFRPGVSSGATSVATWAEVEAYVSAASGNIDILCDPANGACVVPNTASTQLFGRARILPFTPGIGATLTITNGGYIRNPAVIGVSVLAAPTSQSPIVIDQQGDVVVKDKGSIVQLAGTTVPLVAVAAGVFTQLRLGAGSPLSSLSALGAPGVGLVGLTSTSTVYFSTTGATSKVFGANIFSGPVGAQIRWIHDLDTTLPTQTLFLGTFTDVPPYPLANQLLGPLQNMGSRLSLTSGVPITTADVSGSIVYITPYRSGRVSCYVGNPQYFAGGPPAFIWVSLPLVEIQADLSALAINKNYDVFILGTYNTAPTAELSQWTNDTTRQFPLALQDGVLVRANDPTRLYIGTVRTNGFNGPNAVTEDSVANRLVWNNYNQVPRSLVVNDATATWAYGSATVRAARGQAANSFSYVTGDAGTRVVAQVAGSAEGALGQSAMVGVGVDSTTASSPQLHGGADTNASQFLPISADYRGYPGLGFHRLTWLEANPAGGGVTFAGANGSSIKSGMLGEILG